MAGRVEIALRALAALGVLVAACDVAVPAPTIPGGCFGALAYSSAGWMTAGQAGITGAPDVPPDRRVYVVVTAEEVLLDVSPRRPDGSTASVVGRARCWLDPVSGGSGGGSFGPTREEVHPP
jgi:hypothetical protein